MAVRIKFNTISHVERIDSMLTNPTSKSFRRALGGGQSPLMLGSYSFVAIGHIAVVA